VCGWYYEWVIYAYTYTLTRTHGGLWTAVWMYVHTCTLQNTTTSYNTLPYNAPSVTEYPLCLAGTDWRVELTCVCVWCVCECIRVRACLCVCVCVFVGMAFWMGHAYRWVMNESCHIFVCGCVRARAHLSCFHKLIPSHTHMFVSLHI